MRKHHQEAIDRFLDRYRSDPEILAILLCGSIAHGFDKSGSDIDICLVVTPEEFERRKSESKLAFSIWDICEYENGYVDCKVVDHAFMETIAKKGSDAVRYAFEKNTVLYSKIDNIQNLLSRIVQYPEDQVDERRKRFASQMLAWRWYYSEAVKKENKYLEFLAIQKLVLFTARIVLNENRLLYPFHKWMLRVLETAPSKPADLMSHLNSLLESHNQDKVNQLCKTVLEFIDYTEDTVDWPNYFLKDSEQNWISHEPPIDDL